MATAAPLAGRGVLVTRPRDQAGDLAGRIVAAGGRPILFPAIEIAPPSDPAALDAVLGELPDFGLVVFVSPTAVQRAWPLLAAKLADWPRGRRLAAVGAATARALRERGVGEVIIPAAGEDSEALLATPAFAEVARGKVLIVRGEGGREALAESLRRCGARVSYAQCYRRSPPAADPVPLIEAWRRGEVQAVTLTSREALVNLVDLLGPEGMRLLCATPLFTFHARIAEAARARGIMRVVTTPPGDAGLVAGLIDWFADEHG